MVPQRVHTVVISTQHDDDVTNEKIRADLQEHVIKHVVPAKYLDEDTIYHLNPSGRFVIGGPHGDAGLTGRKIIIDTYGGWGAHGGGAFSGKDPTKVRNIPRGARTLPVLFVVRLMWLWCISLFGFNRARLGLVWYLVCERLCSTRWRRVFYSLSLVSR